MAECQLTPQRREFGGRGGIRQREECRVTNEISGNTGREYPEIELGGSCTNGPLVPGKCGTVWSQGPECMSGVKALPIVL